MKISVLSFSYLLFSLSLYSQITFQKTFGGTQWDLAYAVQQTSDKGYIIIGDTKSFGAGASDVYLIKTDSLGDLMWSKTFGDSSYNYGRSIQQTFDGGYIISGYDLIKTNAGGDSLWAKQLPAIAASVQQTSDSGFVVVGTLIGSQCYLLKTDASGDLIWYNEFEASFINSHYTARDVIQTNDGGYALVGMEYNYDEELLNGWLIKVDSGGDTLWTKVFGDSTHLVDIASLVQTNDSGFVLVGTSRIPWNVGAHDKILLIKTDVNGDTINGKGWINTIGDTTKSFANAFSIQQTIDGGYIIGGITDWPDKVVINILLAKTDAVGDTLWTKIFGNLNKLEASANTFVQQTTDGGYVFSASYFTDSTALNYDILLVKTDSLGNAPELDFSISEVTSTNRKFKVYPNPTTGEIIIDLGGEYKKTSVSITDIKGRQISRTEYSQNSLIELSIKGPVGLYLVTVISDSIVSTVKLVKQ
ncbi:MAG: T9SS type A sorting domain-containing protein [Bacteroidetes bacterium]|nr:T9SS type A sorting domain-containing protein [Bacteroidota bacterium]